MIFLWKTFYYIITIINPIQEWSLRWWWWVCAGVYPALVRALTGMHLKKPSYCYYILSLGHIYFVCSQTTLWHLVYLLWFHHLLHHTWHRLLRWPHCRCHPGCQSHIHGCASHHPHSHYAESEEKIWIVKMI